MKKFTKIIVCLLLCVLGVSLVACDNRTPKEKNFTYPKAADAVYGNGGMAVQKGNYVYFVNGYKDISSMTEKNASYAVGSLMLVKLDENGNLVTDENNLLKDEYYITMSDKLCGFEATNLFIGGDYLYFTSPCQEDEGGKEAGVNPTWAKERVEFYRIKLDKTSEPEEVYQSQVNHDSIIVNYYFADNNTYIMVYEQGANLDDESITNALVRVDANKKQYSRVATNVTSAVLAENGTEVFFVQTEDSKHHLKQFNVAENNTALFTTKDKTFKVEAVGSDYVFISAERSGSTGLYRAKISTKSAFSTVPEITSINKYESNYHISKDGYCLVGIKGNVIKLFSTDGTKEAIITEAEDATINFVGFVNGSFVYTDADKNIKVVSYYNALTSADNTITTIAKIEGLNTTYFDLHDNYIYFYKTVGSNQYLHRVALNNVYDENEPAEEMFGVYLEKDIPQTEEESE